MHRGRVGTRRFPSAHVRTIFCVWWRHLACASAVAAGAGPQSGWRQPSGITCHPSTLQSALLEARSSPVSRSKSSLSGSHERLLRRLPLNSNHLHLPNYNATAENPAITFPFRLHMVGCIWWLHCHTSNILPPALSVLMVVVVPVVVKIVVSVVVSVVLVMMSVVVVSGGAASSILDHPPDCSGRHHLA